MTPTTRAERAPLFSFYTLHLLKGNLEIKVEAGSHERRLTLILPHLESDQTLKIIRKSLVSSLNRKKHPHGSHNGGQLSSSRTGSSLKLKMVPTDGGSF